MRTLRKLRSEELAVTNQTESNKRAAFDADIKESLGDSISPAPLKTARESFDPTNNFYHDEYDEQAFTNILPEAGAIDKNDKPINNPSIADLVINAEVLLPHEQTQQISKVIRVNIDSNGNIIGTFD